MKSTVAPHPPLGRDVRGSCGCGYTRGRVHALRIPHSWLPEISDDLHGGATLRQNP
ncbi:hypothetical protein RC1_0579 [Rhodospirillum centenum SW]|uniref:Uncharacterized protein n=1 Tax=Rhodospirillum centenum (strain ATCC 51521 / SW) TaxID=414684 RepID=B6IRC9_RHOCS|nr:hypothetical protein RC1_0579 [Rhodospirillum centenum SW]